MSCDLARFIVVRPGQGRDQQGLPDQPQSQGGVGGPWQRSGFRWLFTGQLVSLAGGSMTPVALSFAVLDASGRAADLAFVLAAQSLALLAFLLSGQYRLGPVVALEVVNGASAAFATPALRGVLPQLVERGSLQRANSILSSSRHATKVVGPTLAGVVVAAYGGGWAIAVDALSFGVAAFCTARLGICTPLTDPPAARGVLSDLREGWEQFRARSWVVIVVVTFAGCNVILAGVWLVLGPAMARQSIGSAGWGMVLSARAIGLLGMSLVLYHLPVTHPLRWGQAGAALFALPLLALGLTLPTPWLAAAALLAGAGSAVAAITWDTALQHHVPQRVLSRVASYDNLGSFATVPLGQLAVVPLAATVGSTRIALAGAILWAALTLGALAAPSVRNVKHEPVPLVHNSLARRGSR